MDPIHPIVPRPTDVAAVAPAPRVRLDPNERDRRRAEQERRRREEAARRRAAAGRDGDGEAGDDLPHVDLRA